MLEFFKRNPAVAAIALGVLISGGETTGIEIFLWLMLKYKYPTHPVFAQHPSNTTSIPSTNNSSPVPFTTPSTQIPSPTSAEGNDTSALDFIRSWEVLAVMFVTLLLANTSALYLRGPRAKPSTYERLVQEDFGNTDSSRSLPGMNPGSNNI